MRAICAAIFGGVLTLGVSAPMHAENRPASSELESIAAVLDDFHAAASEADGERYFGHIAASGVFIGTDASERWTKDEFRGYAMPYFSKGKGWTYTPRDRHIDLAADEGTAWFDELLDNAKYGECRGTGVLQRHGDVWRIEQYHLTIPIPNEIAGDVVERIRGHTSAAN